MIKRYVVNYLGKGYATDKVSDGYKDRIRRIVDSTIAQQFYNKVCNNNKQVNPSNLIVLIVVQWSDDLSIMVQASLTGIQCD